MGIRRTSAARLAPLLFVAVGCTQVPDLPDVVTKGDGFFGHPWPSDTRLVNGKPDMSGFPQREDISLIDAYVSQIEQLDGFGTHAPIFVPLDATVKDLPSPEETAEAAGPLMLLDIDPHSPERGHITPVTLVQQQADTTWQRENMLAIQPVWGFPLRPRTTYALVLTTDFVRPNEDWKVGQDWTDLENTLLAMRFDTDRIGYALQFTTQDPVAEMARFTAVIQTSLSIVALDQTLERYWQAPTYGAFQGSLWVPMWQHGSKPYLTQGGGFVFDDDGMPLLAGWERALFTLTIPRDHPMPDAGWPVVIYGHGTGGNYQTFASGGSTFSPAAQLSTEGIAGFGISLPLHGDRGTAIDPALVSFNYLNPESARAGFRQAALDQIYLATLLSRMTHAFETQDGQARTNPDRVAYMGHSHGGLIGAIAAPFFGDTIKATFLSGAGGGLSTTVVTRDAGDFDIQSILETTLDFSEDDVLVESHPMVAMVQTLAEVTDPINYAPYWFSRTPYWPTTPMHVLMTEGRNDKQTPPATAEALAAAGRLPIITPAAHISDAHQLLEDAFDSAPTFANRKAWTGRRVTAGLVQFRDEDHFTIFNNAEAANLYTKFLSTALNENYPWIQDQ
jgi:hypothetical protein